MGPDTYIIICADWKHFAIKCKVSDSKMLLICTNYKLQGCGNIGCGVFMWGYKIRKVFA